VEQFENNLHAALIALDPARRIWVEDESFTIGSVRIPIAFFKQLRQAPVIFIDVPKEERIKRLVADYTGFDSHLLQMSLDRINKRLGGQHFAKACAALQEQDYAQVADITLVYYDKAYLFGISQREAQSVFKLALSGGDVVKNARQIIHAANAHPLLQHLKQLDI
jgi:tRNA 2-selenouridine synthase